jgi:hypothetical protein
MIEGSGSGSVLVTNESRSGSGRPNNIQILRIYSEFDGKDPKADGYN